MEREEAGKERLRHEALQTEHIKVRKSLDSKEGSHIVVIKDGLMLQQMVNLDTPWVQKHDIQSQ